MRIEPARRKDLQEEGSTELLTLARVVALRERLAGKVRVVSAPPAPTPSDNAESWTLPELAGRMVELGGPAQMTAAFRVVLDAQRRGEPVAWIAPRGAGQVYFPDAAEGGVDLDALAVVLVPDPARLARAADQLARSGAFGLLVLELGAHSIAAPAQTRLLGLAHAHETAILCLTRGSSSLGSLISLRGEARHVRGADDELHCELRILKDKRRSPGAVLTEVCRGAPGLR